MHAGRSEKELDENYGQPLMKKSKDMGINGFLSSGNNIFRSFLVKVSLTVSFSSL